LLRPVRRFFVRTGAGMSDLQHELAEAEELLQERTEMLFDACWALDHYINFLERLGHGQGEYYLSCKEPLAWFQAEFERREAHYEAQEQKYQAAMREKRRRHLRLVK
jgi:hypothetical protein